MRARQAGFHYNNDLIERVARACASEEETIFRILYYDCAPFQGVVKLPVSGGDRAYEGNDAWLQQLATRELFAIRRGVLKFRGFKPRKVPVAHRELRDEDFEPDFEQKGVDMRIGLDMATFSAKQSVDRITLVTGDTDCVPAMKHARIAGLQMTLITFPKADAPAELKWHADICREVVWPEGLTAARRPERRAARPVGGEEIPATPEAK